MIQIADIKPGIRVTGITLNQATQILSAEACDGSVSILGRNDDGTTVDTILFEDQLDTIEIASQAMSWTFTADSESYRLASEAYRIKLAWLFDPMMAVHTSNVEPLPHQITAVYEAMLPRQPLRFILADDPGAGKTIMTGLLLKELIIRGDVKRCLIVSPGSLCEQWQEELSNKFNLEFKILTNEDIEASLGNIFDKTPFCIARLDKLARCIKSDEQGQTTQIRLRKLLEQSEWDLIVCDEAHKMSASWFGGDLKKTKRFQLGEMLSGLTRHFLLLTATPHNGKNDEFELFLSLVDAERYAQMKPSQKQNTDKNGDYSDIMRRLVKEELIRFDGTPLFPERIAQTLNYDLSSDELLLYEEVTEYVQTQFDRAEKVTKKRFNTVGFALTILQRRLASSPEAIYLSLSRRLERLERKLKDIEMHRDKLASAYSEIDWDDIDDMDAAEVEENEEELLDQSTASTSIPELRDEIETLRRLKASAERIRNSNKDKKWEELSNLLIENEKMYIESEGEFAREKLIIFTEHRDTLNYLLRKIGILLGNNRIVTIHGGMHREERHQAEAEFKTNPDITVLIATDAAGEGINLQRAHLMINYDLPWNPNRLEQRFGRIHRIGQRSTCYLWNLVANNTREGAVFQRLFEKLEMERERLGGKVFDILGKVTFDDGKPLRDLLLDAIQRDQSPESKAYFERIVDTAFDAKKIKALLDERALATDVLDAASVERIREEMDRLEARKMQPHFISSFFLSVFKSLGGQYRKRANQRCSLLRVPKAIREEANILDSTQPVSEKYEYICFDKASKVIDGMPEAELVCPGSSLLNAAVSLTLKNHFHRFKEGTIFVDDTDFGTEPKLLFYIESTMINAVVRQNVNEVIFKQVNYIFMYQDGHAQNAGYAPYLDYRAPNDDELSKAKEYVKSQTWLTKDIEQKAVRYAVSNIIQKQFRQLREERKLRYEKIEAQVKSRLCCAINYWDAKANDHEEKAIKGLKNANSNAAQARAKADKLRIQQANRLRELELEKQVFSGQPQITGAAVVIPVGLMNLLCGKSVDSEISHDKKTMEMAGMNAVMAIEKRLGFAPVDVSSENCGYDIESKIPVERRNDGNALRLIEVKARKADADFVTLTRNEILTARNCEENGNYILAVVMVDGEKTETTYFEHIHFNEPDVSMRSCNYSIQDLKQQAESKLQNVLSH